MFYRYANTSDGTTRRCVNGGLVDTWSHQGGGGLLATVVVQDGRGINDPFLTHSRFQHLQSLWSAFSSHRLYLNLPKTACSIFTKCLQLWNTQCIYWTMSQAVIFSISPLSMLPYSYILILNNLGAECKCVLMILNLYLRQAWTFFLYYKWIYLLQVTKVISFQSPWSMQLSPFWQCIYLFNV